MSGRDWDRDRTRTKKSLVAQALRELPTTIISKYPGTCRECGRGYPAGVGLRRDGEDWIHARCQVVRAERQELERRARRRTIASR